MAASTKPTEEKKVSIRLNRINKPNAPQEEFFSVNFENKLIKRGETVEVPESFAEVIANSERAEGAALEYLEQKQLTMPEK